MAPKRSPERDKAFELWRDSNKSIPLKEIAAQLGIAETLIRKWKCQDKWNEKINGNVTNMNSNVTNKRGAPKGSKNAKGHGAPRGNKNAVTTGEHEIIWFDCLTKEEQLLCNAINTDTLAQVEEDIRLITLRERRMMERIKQLMDGLTEKERKVLHELHVEKNPIEVYDEKTGKIKVVIVPESKLIITEVTETEYRKIDDILKVEEALTRVQEKKTRLLTLKHSVELANRADEKQQLEIEKLKAEINKLNGDTLNAEDIPQFVDDIGNGNED